MPLGPSRDWRPCITVLALAVSLCVMGSHITLILPPLREVVARAASGLNGRLTYFQRYAKLSLLLSQFCWMCRCVTTRCQPADTGTSTTSIVLEPEHFQRTSFPLSLNCRQQMPSLPSSSERKTPLWKYVSSLPLNRKIVSRFGWV